MANNGKKTVAILFGGQSAEHDVSLKSTEALYSNLDKEKFSPLFIYISRDGQWRPMDEETFIKKDFSPKPGHSFLPWQVETVHHIDADIYFPMLHGPNGEDGRLQALLEMAGKPFTGAASFPSALAMDKVVSKALFKNAGLYVGDFLFFQDYDFPHIKDAVTRELRYPLFIKPCAMGSSVGITKVENETQLKPALELAFRYDRKVLVEKALDIREIEVSVMGNDEIKVSRPGELIPGNNFYDYRDKYIDGKTTFHMPARLDADTEEEVRRIAGKAYKALFLNGMSRVDLFIEKQTNQVYVNEINTIPGFTEISMFPKLWTLEDISFTRLVTTLIDYGFDFYEKTKNFSVDLH
ncbi:MAG: D-alanine--D-alanine ligase [bacterium]|nr:D-alanine--D-alanine ligase [bacterium]